MKVKILKSFWHGETHFEKGEIAEVSNNMAFGLIEEGFAMKILAVKEVEKPNRNKMMSKKRKLKTK